MSSQVEAPVAATARVTLNIEVDIERGSWGDDCKLDQVYDQAYSETLAILERFRFDLSKKNGTVRILPNPTVTAILVKKTVR